VKSDPVHLRQMKSGRAHLYRMRIRLL
jgi:hypothetical protein